MAVKDSHPYIVETAFIALRDGISGMGTIMGNAQYREYLISQLIEAIKNQNFVHYSLQVLLEFVRSYFPFITNEYVNVLATHIAPVMQNTKDA